MINCFIRAYFSLSSRCNLLVLAAAAFLTAAVVRADDDLASAPYKQATVPIEDRIKDLLGRMTVEEKTRQLDFSFKINYLDLELTTYFPDAIP